MTKQEIFSQLPPFVPELGLQGLGDVWDASNAQAISEYALALLNDVEKVLESKYQTQTTIKAVDLNKKKAIDDYGEKIYGARKDMVHEFAKAFDNVTKQILIEKGFSQVFKQPNLASMVESGALRESDAQFIYAIIQTIQIKPRGSSWTQKTKIQDWAQRTFDKLMLMKAVILADDAQRDAIVNENFASTSKEIADRESHIKQAKEWNARHTEKFGVVGVVKELKIIYEVLNQMQYKAGDTIEIPIKRICAGFGFQEIATYDANNNSCAGFLTEKEAIDDIVEKTMVANPYDGMKIPIKRFAITPDRTSAIKEKTNLRTYCLFYLKSSAPADIVGKIIEGESEFYQYYNGWGPWLHDQDSDEGRWGYLTDEQALKDCENQSKNFAKKRVAIRPIKKYERILGYSKYIISISANKKLYSVTVEASSVDDARRVLEDGYDNINDTIVEMMLAEAPAKSKRTFRDKFSIGKVYAGDHVGSYAIHYQPTRKYNPFASAVAFCKTEKSAKQWVEDNGEAYIAKLKEVESEEIKNYKIADRKFEDYRKGKDINEETFAKKFGFRGIQFGNWTNLDDRQDALNNCYDALLDLAALLNLQPKAISLNGTLGIAFGARGSGWASAHYEPGAVVINLTKTSGAGILGHEWWHALDNHWGHSISLHYFATESDIPSLRYDMQARYNALVNAIKKSQYAKRSDQKGKGYWGSIIEETARLFQVYINNKMLNNSQSSPFLERGGYDRREEGYRKINYSAYVWACKHSEVEVEPMTFEEYKLLPESLGNYPYPTQEEMKTFEPLLDALFGEIKQTVLDNGNVKLSGIRRR